MVVVSNTFCYVFVCVCVVCVCVSVWVVGVWVCRVAGWVEEGRLSRA